ncbi:hypothetical protein BJF85_08450 [Saccharomonospora sp. CUA-673]|uniref:acyl-CoA dehydrogenase family protein n=1 Tax=Saccharomonospora sp. CUA-673 TaxID=1904969 RepID=UPI00095B0F8E|nr:acyl-CoA dehydrogenase family protein [Saccharomonospora sp. CUA-673]OLT38710.1 hypothetical protein BJF85_08450 [Saccharomonospora sp. CUA-673]
MTWLLEEAVAGRFVSASHGETADVPAATSAVPVPGGYVFDGHVPATPLASVWNWLGVHATNSTDPQGSTVVHAFVDRSADGVRVDREDTVLENVFVPREKVVETVAFGHRPGTVSRIFPWALPLLGNVSLGIAERALDTATDSARRRNAAHVGANSVPHTSSVQHRTAEARLLLENETARLDNLTTALAGGYVPDELLATLSAAKQQAADTATQVVDLSLEIAGASSIHAQGELKRLHHDVRTGAFDTTGGRRPEVAAAS